MKIFIDPGHGGRDPGAVANNLKEKDLTLIIAKKIKENLDNNYQGHTTKLSRDKDITQSLKERVNLAKKFGADFFLSIHINAGGGNGFESFIYNGQIMKNTISIRTIIHNEIIKNIKARDRGQKKNNFYVLRRSSCSAMLTENLFIDNKEDAKKLKDKNYLYTIADAHTKGLAKAFGLKAKVKTKEEKIYRVVAGSYKEKGNAEKQVKLLKAKGIDSFISMF